MNALHLPFADESLDVIYGNAMVHHLQDLHQFFSEVHRCLKKRGICRFYDDAYSPVWQSTKNRLLLPLRLYVNKKNEISPEDMVATEKGGYRKDELEDIKNIFHFERLVFIKCSFFLRLFRRSINYLSLFGFNRSIIEKDSKIVIMINAVDRLLGKNKIFQNNLIDLIWGFDK